MTTQYLTEAEIVAMLKARRVAFKTFKDFWADVCRVTAMSISYPHLNNIVHGVGVNRRSPNECVLKYLGATTASVYRIEKPTRKGRG